MKVLFYYLITAFVVAIDQLVETIIVNHIDLSQKIQMIKGVFDITHIQNDGAAYNMFSQTPIILIAIPALVMALGLVYIGYARNKSKPILLIAISMVIGGGLGNLTDRIRQGYVVDYFDIHIIPVFNVADMFICIGCGLLFIYLIFIDGKHHAKS